MRTIVCQLAESEVVTEWHMTYKPWAIKKGATYFYDNFGKCGPISIILSLLDS